LIDKDKIYHAFEGDFENIQPMYDPSVIIDSLADLVDDIYRKICHWAMGYPSKFIALEHGYIFYCTNFSSPGPLLISFGVNYRYRKSVDLFAAIKQNLGEHFECMLHSNNTRAIRWAEKNGMKKEELITNVTYLSI
jgi:hypothetical protein